MHDPDLPILHQQVAIGGSNVDPAVLDFLPIADVVRLERA
jgi:hypothetical protein